ncbi:MAG: hypothetical protein EAX96_17430 [Candidatus Lokiarchaeota archaeon]|nr:hypothetical protein [Candidatus Lokiarchaeota archaeon]
MYRDRDYLITEEGIIFRVYGYIHPQKKGICDVEYASESIYVSKDPRAIRFLCLDDGQERENRFYKFYFDGGLKFIQEKYSQYQVYYKPLETKLVGLDESQVYKKIDPHQELQEILNSDLNDSLLKTMNHVLEIILNHSSLKISDFGCFGSICLDFYHVKYSDIDFIIYGRKELAELRETLSTIYKSKKEKLSNEFDLIDSESFVKSSWKFQNYSLKEYLENEKNKLIYSVIQSPFSDRSIKIEFEPVKKFSEIKNEYDDIISIKNEGWIELTARIVEDQDAFYLQSIYIIEVLDIKVGKKVEILQICNYLEEFRGIAKKNDIVLVKGNLERVICKNREYFQVTISYGMKHHSKQVLKPIKN